MVTLLSVLPPCLARAGRMYDGKVVVCCGHREITDFYECVACKNDEC